MNDLSNFQKLKVLGEGTYGKCYLVRDKSRNELCVLKQIQIMGMSKQQIDQCIREARILQSLNNCYIVQFFGYFQSEDNHLNIIMSYADGGDLSQKIKEYKVKQTVFTQSQILYWFTQVCLALQHVHERKIIHRDIKSQNVFLTKKGDAKLGDFGIARPLQLTLQKIKSFVGTPYYMSPEICQNQQYSLKTDIWSLGVLLLQLCLLKQPFDANSLPALALKISKGQYMPVPKLYSNQMRKLVADMMQVDPAKRPNITEVLNSPLLRDRANIVLRCKEGTNSESSSQIAPNHKKSSGAASRGLFIDCTQDDHTLIEQSISPKSLISNKHIDMPVKRVDNYMKESSKVSEKKFQKRGDQLRRRQISEPNLTPKAHSKIQNQRKVMVKNNSQMNFQKKKQSNPTPVCFKKKTKCNQDIVKSLQEINQCKNDILSLQGQMSHRQKQVQPIEIMPEPEPEPEQQLSLVQQTPLMTLQNLIGKLASEQYLNEQYNVSKRIKGICQPGPWAGLMTLAYGLKSFGGESQ